MMYKEWEDNLKAFVETAGIARGTQVMRMFQDSVGSKHIILRAIRTGLLDDALEWDEIDDVLKPRRYPALSDGEKERRLLALQVIANLGSNQVASFMTMEAPIQFQVCTEGHMNGEGVMVGTRSLTITVVDDDATAAAAKRVYRNTLRDLGIDWHDDHCEHIAVVRSEKDIDRMNIGRLDFFNYYCVFDKTTYDSKFIPVGKDKSKDKEALLRRRDKLLLEMRELQDLGKEQGIW